jgi:hypothetical protein
MDLLVHILSEPPLIIPVELVYHKLKEEWDYIKNLTKEMEPLMPLKLMLNMDPSDLIHFSVKLIILVVLED